MSNDTVKQNDENDEEINTEAVNDRPVKKPNVDDGFFELTEEQIKNLD